MTTGKPWTDEEITIICEVYAAILYMEDFEDRKVNKAAIRRGTLPKLEGRSGGSYEMKMCNISAALRDLGRSWITGYKPLPGYQRSLKAYAATAVNDMYSAKAEFLISMMTEAGALKK